MNELILIGDQIFKIGLIEHIQKEYTSQIKVTLIGTNTSYTNGKNLYYVKFSDEDLRDKEFDRITKILI